MHIIGQHRTVYRYSRPVFLEPHLIRLRPRQDAAQALLSLHIAISPEPAGRSEIIEASGQSAPRVWFEGLHDKLVIRTRFTARTLRRNPFDYLLEPGAERLPLTLRASEAHVLAPFLAPPAEPAVARLADEILRAAGGETLTFLDALNARLYTGIEVLPRLEPGILTSGETLRLGRGACRDVTVVFMEACRAVGIPAAYVSGYQAGDPDQVERDLHAYPEVYLPGAGWRAYDPTLGLVVAEAHLALCSSPTPELTAPVQGSYRGTGAESAIEHVIHLAVTPDDAPPDPARP